MTKRNILEGEPFSHTIALKEWNSVQEHWHFKTTDSNAGATYRLYVHEIIMSLNIRIRGGPHETSSCLTVYSKIGAPHPSINPPVMIATNFVRH